MGSFRTARTTFNYCTEPSGVQVTCWYKANGDCASRTYIGDTVCPATYMGKTLYDSRSECEGQGNGNGNGNDCISNGGRDWPFGRECCSGCSKRTHLIDLYSTCIACDGDGNGGNGNGARGNQKGINKDDIVQLTYSNLKDSICVETEDCKEGVCLPQDYLINRRYLSESKARSTLGSYCDAGDIETFLEILGGYIGLTEGVCGWIFDDYDQWVSSYGYCIADYEDEGAGLTQFLKSIGRTIPITGEQLTDGIIVLGGGILLLILIMSKLYYGEIKYETKRFYGGIGIRW